MPFLSAFSELTPPFITSELGRFRANPANFAQTRPMLFLFVFLGFTHRLFRASSADSARIRPISRKFGQCCFFPRFWGLHPRLRITSPLVRLQGPATLGGASAERFATSRKPPPKFAKVHQLSQNFANFRKPCIISRILLHVPSLTHFTKKPNISQKFSPTKSAQIPQTLRVSQKFVNFAKSRKFR